MLRCMFHQLPELLRTVSTISTLEISRDHLGDSMAIHVRLVCFLFFAVEQFLGFVAISQISRQSPHIYFRKIHHFVKYIGTKSVNELKHL